MHVGHERVGSVSIRNSSEAKFGTDLRVRGLSLDRDGSKGRKQLARPVAENPDMDRTRKAAGQTDRVDIYARITQEIVATIEVGSTAEGWKLLWHHDGDAIARPMSLASQRRYRGITILALWVVAMKSGYASGL